MIKLKMNFASRIVTIFFFALPLIIAEIRQEDLKLIIADENGIWKIENNIYNPYLIVATPNVSAFDFDIQENLIFYNDVKNRKIYSHEIYQRESKLIITQPEKWLPNSIAADFKTKKLYISDAHSHKVDVFDYDGQNHAIVAGIGLDQASKLLLDPCFGKMFINDGVRILSYNMDGSSKRILVDNLRRGSDLAIDYSITNIFWYNMSSRVIERTNYDGDERITQKLPLKDKVVPFAASEQHLYMIDDNVLDIISLSNASDKISYNLQFIKNAKVIKIFEAPTQSETKNPCETQNGDCQQLCFTKFSKTNEIDHSCGCEVGYKLLSDKKSCSPIEDFMLLPYMNHIKSYTLDIDNEGYGQAMIPISPQGVRWLEFVGVGCDTHDRQIYYSTKGDNCMYRSRMNDSSYEQLINGHEDGLHDLTFDWISKNVYYTSYSFHERGRIRVINPRNPSNVKTIINNLYRPDILVVHPNQGYIFYMERTMQGSAISRVNTDGSGLIKFDHLSSNIGRIEHMAIDYSTDRVYWTDSGMGGIRHVNLDGDDLTVISNAYADYPFDIDIYKEHLFTQVLGAANRLYRLDKITGDLIKDYHSEIETAGSGLKVCRKDAQLLLSANPCLENNGGCEEFCFAVPNKNSLVKVCGCSDGETLAANGNSCIKN